ncbi:short-chain dehydrogenase [Marivirga lumbricoides]|uniref:Short-chain dehydrogenase n=2 Tax=Marivirga lumbricoides TaxID=1046115 RepID=A0ABQ1M932_9BACT|nr:short-chain dehydrogenase [Marivirga lumbricoides]
MSRIFITGSADGLGQLAAKQLTREGHQVVLHARNNKRAEDAKNAVPNAEAVLTGDLSDIEETKQLAAEVNALGAFDAIIHNAGVYSASPELIFNVNTLAPYILTCLINKPKRLIYLSSNLHRQGRAGFKNLQPGKVTYGDSKLHIVLLTKSIARLWPQVYANAVDPGWVPTKMGGSTASDDLEKGYQTQIWLATSDDAEAKVSGKYFYHQQQQNAMTETDDIAKQEELLQVLDSFTSVKFVH